MNLLPLLYFCFIGAEMSYTRGAYDFSVLFYTLFFFAVAGILWFRDRFKVIPEKLWLRAVCAVLVLMTGLLAWNPLVIYAIPQSPWTAILDFLSWTAFVLASGLWVLCFWKEIGSDKKWTTVFKWVAGLAILCLITAQFLIPLLSPSPYIDVWVNNTRATDYLLQGLNPYAQDYPDIYRGAYDYKPGFLYFPGLLYWIAPFRAVFGDIRYGMVFANILVALGLFGLSKKTKAPSVFSWLAPLLWLSFPVTYFVLEQAWIDTILIALAALTFLCLEKQKWVLTGILIGFAFAVKQYGFLIGMVAVVEILRRAGWRQALKVTAVGAATFAISVVPFLWSDWKLFIESTITGHSETSVRLDAFNATVFLARELHFLPAGWMRMGISILGILGGAWIVFKPKKPNPGFDLAQCAFALYFSYGIAFLFGKWAFCNYHYLIAGFLLMYVVRERSR